MRSSPSSPRWRGTDMASLLRMPAVAANASEAVLQDWSVEERAAFAVDEPIATVETEKAVVEIDAEVDGVMLKRLVPPGTRVDVGAPIAVLGAQDEHVDDLEALMAEIGVTLTPHDASEGHADGWEQVVHNAENS